MVELGQRMLSTGSARRGTVELLAPQIRTRHFLSHLQADPGMTSCIIYSTALGCTQWHVSANFPFSTTIMFSANRVQLLIHARLVLQNGSQ